MRRTIYRILHAAGWHVSRRGIVRTGGNDMYAPSPTNPYSTLVPWREAAFRARYDRVSPFTVVTPDRCYMIHQFASHAAHLDGIFVECGVFRGGTAMLTAEVLREITGGTKPLHLFDTFEGMPETASDDPGGHQEGDFDDTSVAAVQHRLEGHDNVRCHPGFIPDTLTAIEGESIAFLYADLDLYQSTHDCLDALYDRVVRGGIILCDDYGFPRYADAARRAFDEFFADKPESVVGLSTGQGLVVKL